MISDFKFQFFSIQISLFFTFAIIFAQKSVSKNKFFPGHINRHTFSNNDRKVWISQQIKLSTLSVTQCAK